VFGLRKVPPRFFVSVASKGFSSPVSALESTLTRWLGSAHSKGLKCGRLRPKTGKTRCWPASADSKRVKRGHRAAGEISEFGDRGQGIGGGVRKEFGDRRGWVSTNTKEYSTL
jgi:hypothetical protein